MEEKKVAKIGFSTVIIIIALMIIAVMSYYIYKVAEAKKISDQKVEELSEQVEKLEDTINSISTTISKTKENQEETEKEEKKTANHLISNVDYMEVMVEDTESTEGLTYKKSKKITDEQTLEKFLAKVNNSQLYVDFEEDFGAGGFAELPPMAYIYDKNGNKTVITVSNINSDVNIMMLWTKDDESDKKTYKVDSSLKEDIEQLYE